AIGESSPEEIDALNILNASILAMHRAIEALQLVPEFLLIDGNRFKPYLGIAHACLVEGDSHYRSIAAASVLAKTHRDAIMMRLHRQHPEFAWEQNKGYPTMEHREALALHGPTSWHRRSFRPVAEACGS
ncbi:MAG: ribonuclease HII, partial [Flavobacteriales bacterium]|nr:ribonuclease HII [Flavobacteriales bacterium]